MSFVLIAIIRSLTIKSCVVHQYDEATGEFWRSTFCLRDDVRDSNEYCRVIIFDFFANTTMYQEYLTECGPNLRFGDTNCSSNCQDIVMRAQDYLGCCTRFLWVYISADDHQAHYGTCLRNMSTQCGTTNPTPTSEPGNAHATYGYGGIILAALAFSLMTFV